MIKEGIAHIQTLTTHTTADATLKPDEGYDDVIKQLNMLIDKYNVTVKVRGKFPSDDEET
mgnify:CR=1 FL=1